jgi:hypothetical protein
MMKRDHSGLGSVRASRAGEGAPPMRTFLPRASILQQTKFVSARRVRSSEHSRGMHFST